MTRHRRQPIAFTLIELLVVVAIIVSLVAILLPSMNRAIALSMQASCASNLHQTHVTSLSYATEHTGVFPGNSQANGAGGTQSNIFRQNAYDVREELANYLPSFDIWVCPATTAEPLDHPDNTRSLSYGNYRRFVGRRYPEMGEPTVYSADRIADTNANAYWTMMQDNFTTWEHPTRTNGLTFNFNHGRAADIDWLPDQIGINPSNRTKQVAVADAGLYVDGANAVFYDGHVQWVGYAEADSLGTSKGSASVGFEFGVLPN